jgi:hypothetical protein
MSIAPIQNAEIHRARAAAATALGKRRYHLDARAIEIICEQWGKQSHTQIANAILAECGGPMTPCAVSKYGRDELKLPKYSLELRNANNREAQLRSNAARGIVPKAERTPKRKPKPEPTEAPAAQPELFCARATPPGHWRPDYAGIRRHAV